MAGRSTVGRPPMPGQRPGGPRPMHPTSRGGLIGPGAPPPPPDQAARRPQYNQQQNRGRGGRDRQRDPEERNLRPQTRRDFIARIETSIEDATNRLVAAARAEQAQLFGRVPGKPAKAKE